MNALLNSVILKTTEKGSRGGGVEILVYRVGT